MRAERVSFAAVLNINHSDRDDRSGATVLLTTYMGARYNRVQNSRKHEDATDMSLTKKAIWLAGE